MMKKTYVLSCFLFLFGTTISFADFWTQKASMPAPGRGSCLAVHLGNAGYVGLGQDGSQFYTDLWKYDKASNTWSQMASFTGNPRSGSFGFTSGNTLFTVCGLTATGCTKEVWSYHAPTNAWTQKNDFPGTKRTGACGFVASSIAYMGAGYSDTLPSFLNDFWQYDVPSDTWTQKNSLPGSPRTEALGMASGNIGYFGLGMVSGNQSLSDWWQYDSAGDAWTAQPSFPGTPRHSVSRFSLYNQAYTGFGFDSLASFSTPVDWWQFDPGSQQWTAKAGGNNLLRGEMISFSLNNKGYCGIGRTDSLTYSSAFFEYTPDSLLSAIPVASQESENILFYPNPVSTSSWLELPTGMKEKNLQLFIYDASVRLAQQITVVQEKTSVDCSHLPQGLYYFVLMNTDQVVWQDQVVVR